MSKYTKVNAIWNIPKDGSIKDFPVKDFLNTYRFAKWYLDVNDKNNLFFNNLVEAVDLSLLSLKLSPNRKLTLTSEVLYCEFCQNPIKSSSENILDLQIARNTYFRHLEIGIEMVNELISDYLSQLD